MSSLPQIPRDAMYHSGGSVGYPIYQSPKPAEFYDIDTGIKTSLAKRVAQSPIRYSIMSSGTMRFGDTNPSSAPAVDYNTDTLHKSGFARSMADSKVKYAAPFSKTSRWGKDVLSSAPDVTYDVDALRYNTLAKAVDESPIHYANISSKLNRFGAKKFGEGPDIVYETDQGLVKTLRRSVAESPIRYSIMQSASQRFKDKYNSTTSTDLGPGYYEVPKLGVTRYDQTERQLSSFASGVKRLNYKRDHTKNLGSTYNLDHDTRVWHRKGLGGVISATKVTRPQYLALPQVDK
mmetsp:Transcript_41152/g.101490  ORF Transcript_41152/g.101490 Transcript_41152/m.101490 type:complete len:291 (+) Transcript_41152:282-1154(+)